MSWEWVGPITTAVVGLAGITGTWLTGRAARIEQRELLQLQHKEGQASALRSDQGKVYAELCANMYDLVNLLLFPDLDDEKMVFTTNALSRSLAKVQLFGSRTVSQLAERAVAESLRCAASALREEVNKTTPIGEIRGHIRVLQNVMASNLGISLEHSPEEIAHEVRNVKNAVRLAQNDGDIRITLQRDSEADT
jgi:hypothetical protein